MHHLQGFNHLAILACGVFIWMLGAAWYSPPLFAKPWAAMLGLNMNSGNKKGMVTGMISSFIGDLILSFMLAHFVIWSDSTTFGAGAFVGFIAWLGFVASPMFPQGIYEGRPTGLFWINAGYWLVGIPIAGGILAIWH